MAFGEMMLSTTPLIMALIGATWVIAVRLIRVETKVDGLEEKMKPNGYRFPECARHGEELRGLDRRVTELEHSCRAAE